MAVSPVSASTAPKTLTDDDHTSSASDINIARSNHDIEYAEVGGNDSCIVKKEQHCEIAFLLSKPHKKWNKSIFSLNAIIFSVSGPKLNASSLFQELMLSLTWAHSTTRTGMDVWKLISVLQIL